MSNIASDLRLMLITQIRSFILRGIPPKEIDVTKKKSSQKAGFKFDLKLSAEFQGKLMIDWRLVIIPVALLSSWFPMLLDIADVLK